MEEEEEIGEDESGRGHFVVTESTSSGQKNVAAFVARAMPISLVVWWS